MAPAREPRHPDIFSGRPRPAANTPAELRRLAQVLSGAGHFRRIRFASISQEVSERFCASVARGPGRR
jgi:hypothetical protein